MHFQERFLSGYKEAHMNQNLHLIYRQRFTFAGKRYQGCAYMHRFLLWNEETKK